MSAKRMEFIGSKTLNERFVSFILTNYSAEEAKNYLVAAVTSRDEIIPAANSFDRKTQSLDGVIDDQIQKVL